MMKNVELSQFMKNKSSVSVTTSIGSHDKGVGRRADSSAFGQELCLNFPTPGKPITHIYFPYNYSRCIDYTWQIESYCSLAGFPYYAE